MGSKNKPTKEPKKPKGGKKLTSARLAETSDELVDFTLNRPENPKGDRVVMI